MPMRPCFLALLLSIVSMTSPVQAWTKPKHATPKEVVERSATIAVAKFAEKNPNFAKRNQDLEILQILKGDLKTGKHRVPCEDQPRFANKVETFIVFLDKAKVWRFVADPLNGKKLEDDLLVMDGFYDLNAYVVSPGLVTLEQLQKYLKDKTLNYRFRGAVYFPEAKEVAWKPGSLKIKGTYDAVTEVAQVEGLPELKGIVAQPEVYMSHWRNDETPSLHLQYSRSTSRALILMGKVDGIDRKTGKFWFVLRLSHPKSLPKRPSKSTWPIRRAAALIANSN